MIVTVIDGLGGGIGVQLISQLRQHHRDLEIIALGTNAVATANMVKAGATRGATGENAIRVNVACAEIIVGPLGIIIADALMGEVTRETAYHVSVSPARKLLLPVNQHHVELVGVESKPLGQLIKETIELIAQEIQPAMKAGQPRP